MTFSSLGAFVLLGNMDALTNPSEGVLFDGNALYKLKLIPHSEQQMSRLNVEVEWDSLDLDNMSYQPLSETLSLLAALSTTEFGRSLLTYLNATALSEALNVGNVSAALAAHVAAFDPHEQYVLHSTIGSAASHPQSYFAVASQGALAETALQPESIGISIQPYDSDLAAIAALSTTAFGRSILTLADAAALSALVGTVQTSLPPYQPQLLTYSAVSQSSLYNDSSAFQATVTNLRDNDDATGGATKQDASAWIQIDLGSLHWIQQILLGGGTISGWGATNSYIAGAKLEISVDGVTWHPLVQSIPSMSGNKYSVWAGFAVARYIRLIRSSGYISLTTFHVYG